MGFKMSVTKESLSWKILPEGLYALELVSLQPKKPSKAPAEGYDPGTHGLNINARLVVVNNTEELNETSVFFTLSTKFPTAIQDFSHAFGFAMEEEGGNISLPGELLGDPTNPDSLKYAGPLLGRICTAFIEPQVYNNNTRNTIRYFNCAVMACGTNDKVRHSTCLNKQSV